MLKGNHDYWWNSLKKLDEFIEKNKFKDIQFLHNNSFEVEENIIAGTRGWNFHEEDEDKKVLNRELLRLELSIQDGIKKYGKDKNIIVCMHYPPTSKEILDKARFYSAYEKVWCKKMYLWAFAWRGFE